MKEILIVVQKSSLEQKSATAAHEPEQKHKVAPGIPEWLDKISAATELHVARTL